MKLFSFMLSLVILTACSGKRPIVITGLEGKPLPSFTVQLMDSITQLNTGNIPKGKPIVLFLFSPYCPYCKAQTADIVNKMKSLNGIQFYLLSVYSLEPVKNFYDHFQLNKYPNITVGCDYNNNFGNYYKVPGVPYIAIYSKNKQLKQTLLGKVGTDIIKDIALE